MVPSYRELYRNGTLAIRSQQLWSILEQCRLCPRECRVNRIQGERGVCKAPGIQFVLSSYGPHYGEERPLVGTNGSGTIFFTHCNLRCIYCQNWTISHLGEGYECTIEELATIMLKLQERGCHNINLVTPTHYAPHILKALEYAIPQGLTIPLVYNTSGWERVEILKLLDGIIDIYMPDFKYWNPTTASAYSPGAENYPEVTRNAILEMHRQVGCATFSDDGLFVRGLLIRHLVLPNAVHESEAILEWIASHLPKNTYVNIMAQYTPAYKALRHPALARQVSRSEYWTVVKKAQSLGLTQLDLQGEIFFT